MFHLEQKSTILSEKSVIQNIFYLIEQGPNSQKQNYLENVRFIKLDVYFNKQSCHPKLY